MGDLDCAGLILDLDLAGLGSLRPSQETSEHLASLALITVNSLLAQKHKVNVLLLDNGLQHLGDGQRLGAAVTLLRDVDVEGSVGAHGHSSAQNVRAFRTTCRERKNVLHLNGALALTQTDSLFDRELIEWVEGVLDTGGLDASLSLVDSGLDLFGRGVNSVFRVGSHSNVAGRIAPSDRLELGVGLGCEVEHTA